MKKILLMALILACGGVATAQDKPQDIAKKDLPASAVCAYCSALGTMMTAAKPVAGVMYKGKAYYFHSKQMRDDWVRDPLAYLPPVLPRPMDDIDLADTAGNRWNRDAFKGKLVLVDFWASWCEPCKAMMPDLHALYEKHKGEEFVLLSVSIDQKKKDFDGYLKGSPFANPVVLDTKKTFNSWHVVALPALFLVKDGQVVQQWSGTVDAFTLEKGIVEAVQTRAF